MQPSVKIAKRIMLQYTEDGSMWPSLVPSPQGQSTLRQCLSTPLLADDQLYWDREESRRKEVEERSGQTFSVLNRK